FWYSRVLGDFPKVSNKGVIPLLWIERQTEEVARLKALATAQASMLPLIGGLDVARYGDNLSVLTIRQGDAILSQEHWHHASLTQPAGKARNAINEHKLTSDLVAPTYSLSSTGRIKVETKEELLNRSVKSPDFGDSLVLCFAQDEDPAKELEPPIDEAIQDPIPTMEANPDMEQPWK